MSGEELGDPEMLAHLQWERSAIKLELENVTVVIDFLLPDDLELGLDGRSDLPRHLLKIGRVCELVGSRLLGDVEPVEEQIEPDHYKLCLKARYYKSLYDEFLN